ncbi:tetratricopeptide repeat protein [Ramlibacter sp. G-1-2-2]|uniref:Tetratricopeptide repeat protein n=1 Tax=Ramlibacter agri TaxID=2728837 RepID=A0A848HDT2_9BURK|nr:tetratricopeptide repeat protein [Ramlibacter agri]NML48547.1 tetratricopeptide repeat protein [Ramlibacter agri]
MNSTFEQARAFFLEGIAHYEAGRLPQAEQKFAAALALMPGRPSVLTNLGAVRLKLGRPADALDLLEEAIAQEPANAEALGHCGAAHAELGHREQALALFDRALAADPSRASVWTLRGTLLKELGRFDEAAASFEKALAQGGDPELNRYYLAGLAAARAPQYAPRHYVQALFDGYAAQFDSHLVQALNYQAPRLLTEPLAAAGRRYSHALDLGCGTGLCGHYLRAMAQRVTGVDLSPNMLQKAQVLDVYDELRQGDVLEFLGTAQEQYDLVVAADVFVYVGALDDVFRQLAQLVPAQGSFCFTVEESRDEDLVLRPSLRYAHSESYLRRLAQEHGFALARLEHAPVREDQRQPIPGLFVWMERV